MILQPDAALQGQVCWHAGQMSISAQVQGACGKPSLPCREDLYHLEGASRQLGMEDFRKVLETFRPSGQHSQEYREEQANSGQVRQHDQADRTHILCARRSHTGHGLIRSRQHLEAQGLGLCVGCSLDVWEGLHSANFEWPMCCCPFRGIGCHICLWTAFRAALVCCCLETHPWAGFPC